MEAISVSPLHGLRVSRPKSIRRTRPVDFQISGLPDSAKRNEVLKDVNIVLRNNMPVLMQVKINEAYFTLTVREATFTSRYRERLIGPKPLDSASNKSRRDRSGIL